MMSPFSEFQEFRVALSTKDWSDSKWLGDNASRVYTCDIAAPWSDVSMATLWIAGLGFASVKVCFLFPWLPYHDY